MANILGAQSAEMRAKGEAMIQQADRLLCESCALARSLPRTESCRGRSTMRAAFPTEVKTKLEDVDRGDDRRLTRCAAWKPAPDANPPPPNESKSVNLT
jgi:hypothetical protein